MYIFSVFMLVLMRKFPFQCYEYRIARNIGGDLNLGDWQFGKKTTKLNST